MSFIDLGILSLSTILISIRTFSISFFLQANKFDVALCLISFQACSCFGNRRKIPITNQIKADSVKRNWKQQASKWTAHEIPCSGFQHNSNQKHIIIIWNSSLLTQNRWWTTSLGSLIYTFQHSTLHKIRTYYLKRPLISELMWSHNVNMSLSVYFCFLFQVTDVWFVVLRFVDV